VDPLGFRFEHDAVVLGEYAHRAVCDRLPARLPPGAVILARGEVLLRERCPEDCLRCRPTFVTLLSHQVAAALQPPASDLPTSGEASRVP
jgi:hypothetical protein